MWVIEIARLYTHGPVLLHVGAVECGIWIRFGVSSCDTPAGSDARAPPAAPAPPVRAYHRRQGKQLRNL